MKKLLLFVLMLLPMGAGANEVHMGDGTIWVYKVLSEQDKTCQVGLGMTGYGYEADLAARAVLGFVGENVEIPSTLDGYTVTAIGGWAFNGLTDLKSVSIPNSITSVGVGLFAGCKNLETVTVEEGNTVYDSRGGCNAIMETASDKLVVGCMGTVIPASTKKIGTMAFAKLPINEAIIPDGVETIEEYAYVCCDKLEKVTLASSIAQIGAFAFFECRALSKVTSHIANPFSIQENVFGKGIGFPLMLYEEFTKAPLFVPEEAVDKYKETPGWSKFVNISAIENESEEPSGEDPPIIVPEEYKVDTIGGICYTLYPERRVASVRPVYDWHPRDREEDEINHYFYRHHVVIPETLEDEEGNTYVVTEIGYKAFKYSTGLDTLTIPKTVTNIGLDAFAWTRLKTVILCGDMPHSDDDYPFEESFNFTSVVSLVEYPQPLPKYSFRGGDHVILYVPVGAVERYRECEGWKNFIHIEEIAENTMTGIAAKPGLSVSPAAIYDLQGRKLNVPPSRGLYIQNGRKYFVK